MFEEEKEVHKSHHSLLLEETVIARLEQIFFKFAHRVSFSKLTLFRTKPWTWLTSSCLPATETCLQTSSDWTSFILPSSKPRRMLLSKLGPSRIKSALYLWRTTSSWHLSFYQQQFTVSESAKKKSELFKSCSLRCCRRRSKRTNAKVSNSPIYLLVAAGRCPNNSETTLDIL